MRIRELRKEKKISIEELTSLIGEKSVATVYNYESGRRAPKPEVIVKLANALEVSVDELIGTDAPGKIAKTTRSGDWKDQMIKKLEEEVAFLRQMLATQLGKLEAVFSEAIVSAISALKDTVEDTAQLHTVPNRM